ncbi:hypothetical protein DE146DRAFT_618526 [Phaeosphaeria sp. MPI-PUGE-AT-0046c]|nr:hypothetical protein DE146DRAFT_618526 [Phaeosphaeria sp. MPI-PUGE-AT-0046c]
MTESPPTTPTPPIEYRYLDQNALSTCKGPSVYAPSTCYDPINVVTILVRSAKENTYVIPRGLLIWHSSYFAAALDPSNSANFATGANGELMMEEDVEVFDAFCCWLYTGRLKDPCSTSTTSKFLELYLKRKILYQIWIFAEMRGVPAMKNAAIDMLHENVCASWTSLRGGISYCYENIVRGSALRQYMLNRSTQVKSFESFKNFMTKNELPYDFLIDAIPILVAQGEGHESIGREAWIAIDRCQWHDHSGPGGKLRLESRT